MKEPILSREEVDRISLACIENTIGFDHEKFARDIESALLEKLCGEPAAWITWQSKDGKQKLEYGCIATNPEYCKAHDEWIWTPLYTLKDRQS
ncbi:hypothetical protein [Burkholderia cenocepacia]|uniref:hypothetical protein n=1 Tax=Burkholderia cenocepacia TaxID=95486 RepID=UPI001B9EEB18|nr:hypothetical protein [Burkholderia cenocepacia]MBR7905928.1 hypothetical protein [Burkholderia cenocepacia]MBR8424014.1 hypothetical protein [Burkholderia cenocepacia]